MAFPQVIISNNGPQYSVAVFSKFAEDYGFVHMTSSPKYPQANGEAERAVRTIKSLLKKCSDKAEGPYLALMAYRATPLACGYSPAELLMGRAIRTTVPISSEKLKPAVSDLAILRKREKRTNDQQKNDFDCRHRARSLTSLNYGDRVWLPNEQMSATVLANAGERSYELSTNSGNIIRRNRCQLRKLPQPSDELNDEQPSYELSDEQPSDNLNDESPSVTVNVTPHPLPVTTSSGRVVKPPQRFRDEL